MDLVATSVDYSNEYYIEYGTGLAIEIPEGYVGYVFHVLATLSMIYSFVTALE